MNAIKLLDDVISKFVIITKHDNQQKQASDYDKNDLSVKYENIKKPYNWFYSTYSQSILYYLNKLTINKSNLDIIDIACGDGNISRLIIDNKSSYLNKTNINIIGIDISSSQINLARSKSKTPCNVLLNQNNDNKNIDDIPNLNPNPTRFDIKPELKEQENIELSDNNKNISISSDKIIVVNDYSTFSLQSVTSNESIKSKSNEYIKHINYEIVDIQQLIYKYPSYKNKFDVAIICWCFNYSSNTEILYKMMKNCYDSLKDDGIGIGLTMSMNKDPKILKNYYDFHKNNAHFIFDGYSENTKDGDCFSCILNLQNNKTSVNQYFFYQNTYNQIAKKIGFKTDIEWINCDKLIYQLLNESECKIAKEYFKNPQPFRMFLLRK